MDIKKVRKIQTEAILVLRKFETIDALQWLIEATSYGNPCVSVKKRLGEIEGKQIEKHINFESDGDKFDLYLAEKRTFFVGDDYATIGAFKGTFLFFYNGKTVIETSFSEKSDEYGSDIKIDWNPISLKLIKLSDWVEKIPKIVKTQRKTIREIQAQKRREAERAEIVKISDNFDLGKYQ